MTKTRFSALLPLLLAVPGRAADLTIYNDDLALVRDVRRLDLDAGVNTVRLTDLPTGIHPASLHFKALDGGEVSVLEQNFLYDLVSPEKLLEKYVGREIGWERVAGQDGKRETLKGTLLSSSPGVVLQTGKTLLVNPEGRPVLPELPEGFVTEPTLLWRLEAAKSGARSAEIGYLTTGLSWTCDYVAKLSDEEDRLDLTAWVTIDNRSGLAYKDARVKLLAGDVNRVEAPAPMMEMRLAKRASLGYAGQEAFQEKAFSEYHLYTLQRPATLADRETKQIRLTQAAGVPARKLFVYDGMKSRFGPASHYTRTASELGTESDPKVSVILEVKNGKKEGLGIPLPKGTVRLYKADEDKSLVFLGEDAIDHTPAEETVRLKMGEAFDLVGERKRTDFRLDTKARQAEESFTVTLRNHKKTAATVRVLEHLFRWTQWKVTAASHAWTKDDAQTVRFDVPVPAGGEAAVTYTVRYTW